MKKFQCKKFRGEETVFRSQIGQDKTDFSPENEQGNFIVS